MGRCSMSGYSYLDEFSRAGRRVILQGMKRDEDPERVSLAPLKPVDALRALLKVDPDSEPSEPDQEPKSGESEDKNARE